MDYFNAFWVGGLICALVQILLDKTKLMPGRVMVLLVCTGSVLGAVGIYQPLIDFAGAGGICTIAWFRQHTMERAERSHRHRRVHRSFHRRLHCLRCGGLCCTDFFLPGKLDI